jgi:hypothetical protein
MIALLTCPEYFLVNTEMVTAIATNRVAFTADAAKKKLEAVSVGTLSGTSALARRRVAMLTTTPNKDPARNRSHLEDRRDDSWFILKAANAMDEYYRIELPCRSCPLPLLEARDGSSMANLSSRFGCRTSNTTNELHCFGIECLKNYLRTRNYLQKPLA